VAIAAIERTISWNNISDVNNLTSAAQLIPFVIGVCVCIRAIRPFRRFWESIGAEEEGEDQSALTEQEAILLPQAGPQDEYGPQDGPRPHGWTEEIKRLCRSVSERLFLDIIEGKFKPLK